MTAELRKILQKRQNFRKKDPKQIRKKDSGKQIKEKKNSGKRIKEKNDPGKRIKEKKNSGKRIKEKRIQENG